MTTDQV
jgi:SRSO17 transposase